MSEQKSSGGAITQYLLGALPEAEAERWDELSVSDQAFAEALTVAEKDLIDAYVLGELEASLVERFKSYYLASPIRRERARFAEAFQVFAARRAAEAAAIDSASHTAKRKHAGWSSMLSTFTPRLAWQWGLAAAVVVLLVTGGWLVLQNVRFRQQAAEAHARRDHFLQRERELQKQVDAERATNSAAEQELARLRSERERLEHELAKARSSRDSNLPGAGRVVSFVLAAPLRGVAEIPAVFIPASTSLVATQLQLEPNQDVAYRVVLLKQSNNQTLWRSGKLKAKTTGEDRALNIIFGGGLLNSQAVYILRVAGIKPDGAVEVISDYSFRVGK